MGIKPRYWLNNDDIRDLHIWAERGRDSENLSRARGPLKRARLSVRPSVTSHFSPRYIFATVDPIYPKFCTHTPWGLNYNVQPSFPTSPLSSATNSATFLTHIFRQFSPSYISVTVDPIYPKFCTHTHWGLNYNICMHFSHDPF